MAQDQRNGTGTFVLVHGAWAGAWSWVRVVDLLTARGHRVFAPALSGLGERSHLAGCNVNLTTHVNDIVNEIKWEDLDQIVLVGHSYGGLVITRVAEQVRERIASIVYLAAFIPANGQAFVDFAPGWNVTGEMVAPPPTAEGDYLREGDRAWVDGKATPQPTATLTEKLRVTGAYQRVPRKTFIRATGWAGPFDAAVATARSDPSWTVYEIACGHDVAIDKPDELAAILEASI
ncbi:MAG: alpha/beta fold hydrolase [Steroidobacteraceae bacterium]